MLLYAYATSNLTALKGSAKGVDAMDTITAKVTSVNLYVDSNKAEVRVVTNKTFDGFDTEANGFAKTTVNFFKMKRGPLTAQLCSLDDDIALFRAMREHSFGQKELAAIFFNASIEFTREFKAAGEIVDGVALTHDTYWTTITGITLSSRAKALLNAAITL